MANSNLNNHGQFSVERRTNRDIDEFIGICKGVLADGHIVQAEAEFLQHWLNANQVLQEMWPVSRLYDRLNTLLATDKAMDSEAEYELIALLNDITGGPLEPKVKSMSTTLPLDDPPPAIVFKNNSFCLTGQFITGSRDELEKQIEARGGIVKKNVVIELDYLVVGAVSNEEWIHSTYGRKIEKAVEYRQRDDCSVSIVSEEYWVRWL